MTSLEGVHISDDSRQIRSGHPRSTTHSQRHRRTTYRRRSDNKGPWMKSEKINGHGSFGTFLVQFEIVVGIIIGIGRIEKPIFAGL